MRKFTRFGIVLAALFSLLLTSVDVFAAATAPAMSGLKAVPALWDPAASRLAVSANISAAGDWTLEVFDSCTGDLLRTLNGEATAAGKLSLTLDGAVAPVIPAGVVEIVITPKAKGGAEGTAVSVPVTVGKQSGAKATDLALCGNASRLVAAGDAPGQSAAAALRARTDFPQAKSVFLVGTSKSSAITAVAAVASSQRNWPVLLTDPLKLSYATKVELKRRSATKVVLLGTTKSISKQVATALRRLGYQVIRRDTDSPLELAGTLYRGAAASGPAVYADLYSNSATVLQAVAFANGSGLPLLHLNDGNIAEVKSLLKAWGRSGGTAVGAVSESAAEAVKAVRVSTKDAVQSSLALARAVQRETAVLHLVAQGERADQSQLLSMSAPQLLLVLPKAGLNLAARTWLNGRGDLQSVRASGAGPSDAQTAAVARLIAARGEPTEIETLQPEELGALSTPPTFAFSGAGWGHGVGLSQWGAYQMAVEGKTAEEIVTYYFQNTKVEAAPAAADIYVSLQNRIATAKFRVLPVNGSKPAWRVISDTDDGSKAVDLTSAHTVSLQYLVGGSVKISITGPGDLKLPNGRTVRVLWSGTRFADDLGDAPALLQFAGEGESLTLGKSDSGRRYRFGLVRVKAAPATSNLDAGLQVTNRVRLADEYIYGIGEVSSSWPSAALEAQVLAARSYAYHDVYESDGTLSTRSSTCDCHVYDDTRDQNYVGWSKLAESVGDRWKAAVDASVLENADALVVKYGRVVVQTFFAASTGGVTQNVQDVWGGSGKPYLVSVPDPWSLLPAGAAGLARWSPRVRAQKTVAAAFSLPQVSLLDFSDRYPSGGLRTVTATSPDGKKATITGEQFRVRVKSDTGTTLNSTWVWRSLISPRLAGSRVAASDLLGDIWLGYLKVPAATADTAVLVTQSKGQDAGLFAVAAAHAGAQGWALVPVSASGDGTRVKNLLAARGITNVVLVGDIDPALVTTLETARLTVREAFGEDQAELAVSLADELSAPTGVVLVSSEESQAWPLAVNIATRTGRPLLPVVDGALPPAVALWLTSNPSLDVIAVGTASAIPDRALAGLTKTRRLNTADLSVSSRAALQLSTSPVRAVSLTASGTDVEAAMTAAALGFPLLYPDADNRTDLLAWLRRQSLATAVVDAGAGAEWATEFSRA